MRKHTTLKALGATALAVATVASGLSFGSAAASADSRNALNDDAPAIGKLAFAVNGKWFAGVNTGGETYLRPEPSAQAAERSAIDITVPGSSWSQIRAANGTLCLKWENRFGGIATWATCATSTPFSFKIDGGKLIPAAQPDKWLERATDLNGPSAMQFGNGTPATLSESLTPNPGQDGGFESTQGYSYSLEAGASRSNMQVPVRATGASTLGESLLSFTAPSGTKFTPGQHTAQGRVGDGSTWAAFPALDAKLTISADGKSATGTIPAGAEIEASTYYSWHIGVTADADAKDSTSNLDQTFVGEANGRTFIVRGNSSVTVKASKNEFTAGGTFDADATKNATVSGTGINGSTMKLYAPNGAAIGTATVTDGKYSFSATAPGAGVQTFKVSQTTNGVESPKKDVVLNYGAAVAITGPATGSVAPGDVTVTGTGVAGAKVTITGGAKPVTTTVGADNTFSAPVEIAPSSSITTITASQQSKGNLTTSATVRVTADGKQDATSTAITGPADGVYEPMKTTTVTGTATAYAKVVITNQWNVAITTVTADKDGMWSFDRVYGPAAEYQLTANQTRLDGTTSKSAAFALAPLGSFKSLTVDNESPATYTAGKDYTFTGTATPGATITATNQWGTKVFETRAAQSTGMWSAARQYGPTAEYTLTFHQKALDGRTDKQEGFVLKPLVTEAPMTITSHKNGDSYRPGTNTFTGVGTPGATITARNQWNTVMGSATVSQAGDWAFERTMGPSAPYTLTFTQTKDGKTINAVPLNLTAPVVQDFTLTSPAAGDTYTPLKATTFTGKASAFSKITVTTTLGTKVFETEADQKGNWSHTRAYGPTNTYTLNFDETTSNGTTTRVLKNFIFAPDAPATK